MFRIFYELVGKNLLYQWASTFFIAVLTTFVTIALARQLGVNEFGNYSYVLSLATIFMVIQDGGYKTLLYRDTIDGPNKNLLPFAIYHVFIVTFFGVLVVAFLQPNYWLTILAAFFCTGLIVITIYVSSLLKGYGDFKLDAVWKLSVRILSAIGILTALFFQTDNTIFFVFIAWSISLLICLIWPMRKKYLVLPAFKFRKKII